MYLTFSSYRVDRKGNRVGEKVKEYIVKEKGKRKESKQGLTHRMGSLLSYAAILLLIATNHYILDLLHLLHLPVLPSSLSSRPFDS